MARRKASDPDQLALFAGATLRPVEPPAFPDELRALGEALPPEIRLGGSTWSFPGWTGLVYDRKASSSLLARHGLAAYAEHPVLGTVGIDRTYYRPLEREEFRDYARQTPEPFRFVVKAHEEVTLPAFPDMDRYGERRGRPNPRFLDAAYTAEEVVRPMVEGLGEKAGVLVFQFSPGGFEGGDLGSQAGLARRLRRFLEALPRPGNPREPWPVYAVELRNRRLFGAAYAEAVAEAGAAHCLSHHPSMPDVETQAEVTLALAGPALVVRWMLHAGLSYDRARERYLPFDRLVDPDPPTRQALARLALAARREGRETFVTINNKAEGSAPRSAIALAEAVVDLARSGPEGGGDGEKAGPTWETV